jgi:hypothetical protein
MLDFLKHFPMINAKHGVEISIKHDGLIIWINVDEVCIARIITNGMVPIDIKDERARE